MDILKISELELCDLIIEKHRKAREAIDEEMALLKKASLLYEKHDQLKHRAQMCQEQCETQNKINRYLEDEKRVSEELSRVRATLKNRFGHPANVDVQQKTSSLKQGVEKQDNSILCWKNTKARIRKEITKTVKKKKPEEVEKAEKPKKPAKKTESKAKTKPKTKPKKKTRAKKTKKK